MHKANVNTLLRVEVLKDAESKGVSLVFKKVWIEHCFSTGKRQVHPEPRTNGLHSVIEFVRERLVEQLIAAD
jgi:hypothetical protein